MTRARPPHLLGLAVASFAACFGALAVLQHRAFSTGRFDLGNLTQVVWSTAHGRPLEMTSLAGEQISRLGAHFDPLVAALAPLWWVWPDATLLLVVQAIAVALGALPVFALARRHLGSEWAGLGFALVYLLYPPTQWLVLDDFHPVAFATPLLLGAIWHLDGDRLLPFCLLAGLACLTKEHVGLVVAGLGIWYACTRRRRAGALVAAAGAAVSALAIGLVIPHFAPAGRTPFEGRYEAVGGSATGIVRTAVSDPGRVAREAASRRDLAYVFDLLAPLGGLPLLAPAAAATAIPELATNVLSDARTQTSIHFHYGAVTIPSLVFAAVLGAARLQRRLPRAPAVVPRAAVGVALAAGIAYGPLPLWSHLPLGEELAARDHLVDERDRAARRVLGLIPPGDAVSATNTLGAHLSERRRVLSFPRQLDARWIVVDERRLSYLDAAVAPGRGARALARLRADPRWRLVAEDAGILLFRR